MFTPLHPEIKPLSWKPRGINQVLVLGNYYWNSHYHRNTLYIRAFKAGNLDIGKAYANTLATSLTNITADCIIPVPGDPERNMSRGYNPSSVLAEELSKATGLPIINALEKKPCTRAYVTSKKVLAQAYTLKSKISGSVISGNVLLVDDLIANGKTKRIVSSILRKAGVKSITVICIARACSVKRPEQLMLFQI